ncbi:PilZ domain-containing protein, partial [Pseudomonadota bacterium]
GSSGKSGADKQLYNVSYGGVACHSDLEFEIGDPVTVRIPNVTPPFEVTGMVVWCEAQNEGYELGIQFNEGREAFVARMVAQVCQIEQYKIDVQEKEGRILSGDEAALEWIEKHAHQQRMQERAFIRHPLDVPIELSRAQKTIAFSSKLHNFSMEGACFESDTAIALGECVQLQVPGVEGQPERTLEGIVVWCCEKAGKYDVGVKFRDDNELINTQMLKQLSRLECFKEEIKRSEGRDLTGEEAVKEFIAYMSGLDKPEEE